jgi:hypothetical protein
VDQLGPNALGEVLGPGRATDCYLGLLLPPGPAGEPEAGTVLVIAPAGLLHPRVPQPDGSLVYGLLTYRRAPAQATGRHRHGRAGWPGRTPGCDRQWPEPLLCARQRCRFCLATRRSSYPLATGASVGPALVDTSKTVQGGTST